MIIKTRKLPPTTTEPARMRATSDRGHSLTIPYPHGSLTPNKDVATCLARAVGRETTLHQLSENRYELGATRKDEELS